MCVCTFFFLPGLRVVVGSPFLSFYWEFNWLQKEIVFYKEMIDKTENSKYVIIYTAPIISLS